MDPLSLLRREDKWFLGGGKDAIYAPPFPRFLETPGFWDECYLADIRIPHLFAVLLTSLEGKPIRPRSRTLDWRPDRLVLEHVWVDQRIVETRCVIEANAWVSELCLEGSEPLHAVQWALLDVREQGFGAPWQSLLDATVRPDRIEAVWGTAWPSELSPDRSAVEAEKLHGEAAMLPALPTYLAFGGSSQRQSNTVNLAQRHDDSPRWETSLLPQKLRNGLLPGDFKLWVGTEPIEGLAHLLQQFVLEPGVPLRLACGAGFRAADAQAALSDAISEGVVDRSEQSWRRYFQSVPQFSSSDPYLTNAYWYRWYGLRLNTVVGMPNVARPPQTQHGPATPATYEPFVTEGIGFFRNFVTYSAQAHLREVAWMHDPSLAIGILDNLGLVQREDGSFPGHNYSCRPSRDFYHADFATGILQLHRLHPGAVGKAHLGTMRRYADYFLRDRTLSKDPAGPTLYDVFDQNETGQEYMSRYQFASEDADKWSSFRVSGVDATVYAFNLFAMLAEFRTADSPYNRFAAGARFGLAELSFDPESAFFCDVRADGVLSPARPATGMYPLGSLAVRDLWHRCGVPMDDVLDRWLLNEAEFWRPAGFPATAASDVTYSRDGEWKERRLNCPWNGRSWPMANSHLVDAVAAVARQLGEWIPQSEEATENSVNRGGSREAIVESRAKLSRYRLAAGDALMKSIRLMFHDGAPSRPNSYEHYDPETGTPALYRGYDDYMHSWIVDLILRHAVGVRPGWLEVDPLPLDVDWIECTGIPHPDGLMSVRIERGKEPLVSLKS